MKTIKAEKYFAFINNAPFRSCMSKLKSTLIDNAENLNIVMPMYNLLEYNENYPMTSGSLWNYQRDEIDNIHDNGLYGKSVKYKTKTVGKTPARPINKRDTNRPAVPKLNVEVTIPFKYVSIFWRFLDLLFINSETEHDLSQTKECVLIEHHSKITGVNVMITSTKLYVPIVSLPVNDNTTFSEKIKHRFKRTIFGTNIDLK